MERVLDEFFSRDDIKLSTRRLYLKLKCCAKIYADTDYADISDQAEALSRGWEEIHVAFLGKAEYFLSTLVQSIWGGLDPSQYGDFHQTLVAAVALADKNTSPEASRIYISSIRKSPFFRPGQNWTFTVVIPNKGPRLKEWAIEKGLDPDKMELAHYYMEIQDRLGHQEKPDSGGSTKSNGKGKNTNSVNLGTAPLTPHFTPVNSSTLTPRFTLIKGGKGIKDNE